MVIFFAFASSARAETRSPALTTPLDSATRSYQSEKFDEALAALDQFDKANAPSGESLDLRGCIYMEKGNFGAAAKAFEAARTTDASRFAPRLHEGDLWLRQKEYAKARAAYGALLKETNILLSNERLRFAIMMTYLGERDENLAKKVFDKITFPTQSPTYYYAQAAWAFAHDKKSDARKWIKTAARVYPPEDISWFARILNDFGWIKEKPAPTVDKS